MNELCDSYEDWKHCITVRCKIPLTPEFVSKRLAVLSDPHDATTARFVQLYGDAHRLRVVQWFEQARGELESIA